MNGLFHIVIIHAYRGGIGHAPAEHFWSTLDIATGVVSPKIPCVDERIERAVVVAPGSDKRTPRMFSFGGTTDTRGARSKIGGGNFDIEYFDSVSLHRWVLVRNMLPHQICRGAACLLNPTTAIVCGGVHLGTGNMCIELDLETFTAKPRPNMMTSRYDHAVVLYQGAVIAIGGVSPYWRARQECERLAPDANEWTPMAPPNEQYYCCSAVVIDDRLLYVVNDHHIEVYDGVTWTEIKQSRIVAPTRPFEYRGKLTFISKINGEVATLDPDANEWTLLPAVEIACRNWDVVGSF